MAELVMREVTKTYPGGHVALDDVSISVPEGEFLILVGPSGCGKSTALRLVAGLDTPSQGEILIDGKVVNRQAPGERDIAMVFQNYALYPHMSVYKNLAYGLKQRRTPRQEVDRRVREMAEMLELDELLARKPGQLSGGQRQRVAMGRALVRRPQVFLLDEPLSNLDAKLRGEVRAQLKRLHRQMPVTSVYVTHDQVEAMTLGDRIALVHGGRLQQIGTPDEVYETPANAFVASFIGSPPMNLLPAVAADGRLRIGSYAIDLRVPAQGEVTAGIRPECLRVAGDGEPSFAFRVDVVEPLGSEVVVHGAVSPGPDAEDVTVVARFEPQFRPQPGTTVPLTADPAHVHLFSAVDGAAIR